MIEEISAIATIAKSKIKAKYFVAPLLALVIMFGVFALTPFASYNVVNPSTGATVCTLTDVSGLNTAATGSNNGLPTLICSFCQIYGTITFIILFVALGLLALGGILYAGAHLLPGQQRGGLQGYGFGMIIGGIVGIILVILAPFIISTVVSSSSFNPFVYVNMATNPGTGNAFVATVGNICVGTGLL